MAIEVETKKWGNSIGIVIPNKTVEKLKLKPEEIIMIDITKKENVLKEMFGRGRFNESTEELLKESRKELASKWLK